MNTKLLSVLAATAAATLSPLSVAEPIWSYDEALGNGPSNWGNLSPEYLQCAQGQEQSPVDLAGARPTRGRKLKVDYRRTELVIENTARTIEVVYEPGSFLRIGGDRYQLLQFHFHTPSEHRVGGAQYPMEVHFVHRNAAGQLAVVGVLLEEGRHNTALQSILANAPEEEGETHVPGQRINAASLMPSKRGYRHYEGSLTTPPCSEGVRWFVLRKTIEISASQVYELQEILRHVQHYPYNARPDQPLNGRAVTTSRRK